MRPDERSVFFFLAAAAWCGVRWCDALRCDAMRQISPAHLTFAQMREMRVSTRRKIAESYSSRIFFAFIMGFFVELKELHTGKDFGALEVLIGMEIAG